LRLKLAERAEPDRHQVEGEGSAVGILANPALNS
jgi:hypothetical protein